MERAQHTPWWGLRRRGRNGYNYWEKKYREILCLCRGCPMWSFCAHKSSVLRYWAASHSCFVSLLVDTIQNTSSEIVIYSWCKLIWNSKNRLHTFFSFVLFILSRPLSHFPHRFPIRSEITFLISVVCTTILFSFRSPHTSDAIVFLTLPPTEPRVLRVCNDVSFTDIMTLLFFFSHSHSWCSLFRYIYIRSHFSAIYTRFVIVGHQQNQYTRLKHRWRHFQSHAKHLQHFDIDNGIAAQQEENKWIKKGNRRTSPLTRDQIQVPNEMGRHWPHIVNSSR